MSKQKAFLYTVDGWENDVDKFAKGILMLVNAKSSRKGTVLDVKTLEGTNIVLVTSLTKIDKELESMMGYVRDVETIDVYNLTYDDLTDSGKEKVKETEDMLDDEYMILFEKELD